MEQVDLTNAAWFKSSHSDAKSACVEAAFIGPDVMPVRDSKDPDGPALVFRADAWRAFVAGVRAGDFPADC
ncbi:DUF397 domain-containing protein [Kitasatospora mediocidica]|uniref:DUF397 domain-containing protein n=1 Tax=Kitasatospora mediocidica TaxID=58352 RepID=UPI00055F34BD|nr:DUF397 domain-containing protein [Kitasatospora mediocidica]